MLQVGARFGGLVGGRLVHQVAAQLVEGLARAPVFLALVRGQLQGHHGNGQLQGLGQAARIVLDQLGRAGGPDNHGLGLEARVGVDDGGLEQFGRVGAEIARLEGRVGDGRAGSAPLDHREQQVGIGIALGGVQDVVQTRHRRGDPHGTDVRRAFVGPDGQLHGVFLRFMRPVSGGA
jgi:hypothetical protein